MIAAHIGEFAIGLMCRALKVSRSGFHAWRSRMASNRVSDRQKANGRIVEAITEIHKRTRRSYGSPRMHDELTELGLDCGLNRTARLMRENGLAARIKRRFTRTTDSEHSHPIAPNLLDRSFNPARPNEAWASDITYVATRQGWLFVAVTLDLFSRAVVGWAMGRWIDAELVARSLNMAIENRRPPAGLLHHSDRGSQYTSSNFQSILKAHRIVPSMSRRGDCWDNAVVESFFGSMKWEWLEDRYETRAAAARDVFEFIEVFYNRQRRHSTLGNISPIAYERQAGVA